jgi:proteasome lid subunit RPN8/RPN11
VRRNGAVGISESALAAIRAEAGRAYPREGCGALLGPDLSEIRESIPLANRESLVPQTRFHVSPADYIGVEEQAEARGLQLLGFWHSHPDHPARPSSTDRDFAWESLLTLVIAVERGHPGDLTAWEVDGVGFRELPLEPRT